MVDAIRMINACYIISHCASDGQPLVLSFLSPDSMFDSFSTNW